MTKTLKQGYQRTDHMGEIRQQMKTTTLSKYDQVTVALDRMTDPPCGRQEAIDLLKQVKDAVDAKIQAITWEMEDKDKDKDKPEDKDKEEPDLPQSESELKETDAKSA